MLVLSELQCTFFHLPPSAVCNATCAFSSRRPLYNHQITDVQYSGLDEGPRAYVVPWEPGTLSTEEVANFLVGKVSPYKYLTGGVSFMEKIPRNAVSYHHLIYKIQRVKVQVLTFIFQSNRQERSFVTSSGIWPRKNWATPVTTTASY